MRAVRLSCCVTALAVLCVLCISRGDAAHPGAGPGGAAAPGAGERVTFQSADPGLHTPIPATIYRPEGSGPFPAVVLLHPCSGPQAYNYEWAAWLRGQGYLAIVPNSLSPRHTHETCAFSTEVAPRKQALDGVGALAYLRSRPDVIPTKIAVMGWSHGGGATLASVSPRLMRRFHPQGGGYQAAVALYPGCQGWKPTRLAAPLLMLIAQDDDWGSPAECVAGAEALRAAGSEVAWKVYAGAMHGFDAPAEDRTVRLPGGAVHHLRYDAAAAADAHTQVQRFLSAHLR